MRATIGFCFVALALAGCSSPEDLARESQPSAPTGTWTIEPTATMHFEGRVVSAAVDLMGDTLQPTGTLFEPNIDVSDTGVIYISGHTILVDTTGAPVYMSHDDGLTWSQLPFLGPVALPSPLPGATPPPSDELFLVAGDDGWLYGVDITLATYPVNAWAGDGAQLAYHNPNALDEQEVALHQGDCEVLPIADRPWAAYSNGRLLMVNNPASGPAQVGVLPMPPASPAGIGSTTGGGTWNMCAGPGRSQGDCSVPGIPGLRPDGLFAAPQPCEGRVHVILGNVANVMDVRVVDVLPWALNGEYSSKFPHAGFDADGTLFVAVTHNTGGRALEDPASVTGGFQIAVSQDGGASFTNRTLHVSDGPIRNLWVDANRWGPGMLAVWAVDGETAFDWYVGHVFVDETGLPIIQNVALAVDEGTQPYIDLQGSALGPDGRAYLAMYEYGPLGGTPLSVWVQQDGPTMPIRSLS